MERSEINQRFIEKNQIVVDDLNEKVKNETVAAIIMSIEMSHYLKLWPEFCDINNNNELLRYLGKRVIVDAYCPVKSVRFIRKFDKVDFDIPCICGYFSD